MMGGGNRGGAAAAEEEGGEKGRANAKKIAVTSVSAAVAETATFPIDAVKTRLQLQYRGGGGGGVLGIYRGLSPAVLRHLFYTPIRIIGYEHLRGFSDDSLVGRALCGGISGIIAQVVASPADLIKVRMQADAHLLNQGIQPRYVGIIDAFRRITQVEGFQGLWKGVIPNAQRAFLVNMGELACYDQVKHSIINNHICGDNTYAHTLASIASGLSATTLSCPADVVKTRMMNQTADKEIKTLYRSSYDCLVKTVKYEGIMALWKGFLPTWARLGPWQLVFWVSYENFRQTAGLSSF